MANGVHILFILVHFSKLRQKIKLPDASFEVSVVV
jgi:hypothetical protein